MTDDVTAFERQLARGLDRLGGSGRRIDATAMVRTVTTTTPLGRWAIITRPPGGAALTPPERGSSMSSAVKFVAAAAIVALFGGLLLVGLLSTQQRDVAVPGAVAASASPTASKPVSGTVSVTIDGLEGAIGSRLVAILYEGVPVVASGDTPWHGLGAFTADITGDPFSVTDTIREGSEWWDSTADDPVASVPPGIQTVIVYVSHRLAPYNAWLPAGSLDAACAAHLTVTEGRRASVRIAMPEDSGGVFDGLLGCEVLEA